MVLNAVLTTILDNQTSKNQHPAFEQDLTKNRTNLLFKINEEGNLSGTKDPSEPANSDFPLLYICSTAQHSIIAVKAGSTENWVVNLKRLIEGKASEAEFNFERIIRLINESTPKFGKKLKISIAHAYVICQVQLPSTNIVEINQANKHLIEKDFPHTFIHIANCSPCLVKIINERIVSICRTVRKSELAMECGVDTLAEFRGNGYGTEVVEAWAAKVLKLGLVPLYSVNIENKPSLAITWKIGMHHYANDISVEYNDQDNNFCGSPS